MIKNTAMNNAPKYINVKGDLLDLSVPKVMGIINVTPDSFYKASRYQGGKRILNAVSRLLTDRADIIDIGGYSTRPGADDVPEEEEKKRVLKAVRMVNREFPGAVLSVDTFRSEVAREAVLDCGAAIINDISGGEADERMFRTVEELNVPYILMHMQGVPGTMQQNPSYDDVVADILRWFGKRINRLQSVGVKDIIIDPGFGFGKTIEQNFILLDRLGEFSIAGLPLLAGLSRKSMVWKTLELTPDEALNGTSILNAVALLKGADILRVHDVSEAVQAIRLITKLKNSSVGNQPDRTGNEKN